MATTPQAVRLAVEEKVTATTLTDNSTPLTLSLYPQLYFGDAARSPRHMEFAVGASSSEAVSDRARSGGTVLTRTVISVSLAFQLSIQDPTSFGKLLAAEDDIRRSVNEKSVTYPVNFQIRWLRSNRVQGPTGWVYSVSEFEALHLMTI